MMLAPKTRETKMRLLRALLRNKSTAAAAAGKPIAHIYPNSETPVKALDPRAAASIDLQRFDATARNKEDRRLTRANRALTGTSTGGRGTLRDDARRRASTQRGTAARRRWRDAR